MPGLDGDAERIVYILVAGALATFVWRFAGVFFAGRISEDSEIIGWVRAVATALIAGIIARIVLFPTGSLADAPLWVRIVAVVIGFAIALRGRRWTFVGILAGMLVLVAGWYLSV